MRTKICERLGCEVPIFAFSHCRDVVVEVTKAGGFGVLGAATFSPEQLEAELRWIDEHVAGRPYGVDVLIPTTYDAAAEAAAGDLEKLIPAEHKAFMEKILADEGVPPLPPDELARVRKELVDGRGAMTPEGARALVRTSLKHPQVKMVVSALGAPPADVVAELRSRGVVVGALCGKASHAVRQKQAGVEVIIAQGTEAGGHTGDIATLVLVPQVVEVCGSEVPVLAAGGITRGSQIAAALALGAEGVWCGTIWLGTRRASSIRSRRRPSSRPRPRTRCVGKPAPGKTVRMIKSKLSEAWEKPGAPPYLPTPLQGVLYNEAHARVVRARRKDLYSFPGRAVGRRREQRDHRARRHVPPADASIVEAMERLTALHGGG